MGVALQIVSDDLPQRQQEGLETVVGLIAVVMVTYMVLWMRRHSRDLKHDLEAAGPVSPGHGHVQGTGRHGLPRRAPGGIRNRRVPPRHLPRQRQRHAQLGGRAAGHLLAVILGYLIYKGGLRINLSRFFRVTGIVLVVIAAGLVMTAVHTANEAGWINFGQTQAFDLSWLVRPGTPLESFVTGVLGIQPYPVWIEVIA